MVAQSRIRHVILVGSPRCGTMHIAHLYQELFAANQGGVAQHQGPIGNILSRDIPGFDADWRKSGQIYQLSRQYPWMRFIVMCRDAANVASSLRYFYTKRGHADKELPIEKLVDKYWIQTYRKILSQLDAIDPKPFFMQSEAYFMGLHDELLLNIFDLPHTAENFAIIQQSRKKRINSYGADYPRFEIPPGLQKNCNGLEESIQKQCRDSWIVREVYGNEDLTNINPHYPPMHDMYKQKIFGMEMGQTFTALYVFEWILNNYPIDQIVELGTGRGGLSFFLALQARCRKIRFTTYDARHRINDKINYETCNPPMHMELYLAMHFRQKDVFRQETINEIAELVKDRRALIYCDNGAKPREVKTYAPLLAQGSIIGTHDWHGHFDVDDLMKELNMKVIFQEFCEKHRTRQRFWYKIGNGRTGEAEKRRTGEPYP